jgi:hypothetical protein
VRIPKRRANSLANESPPGKPRLPCFKARSNGIEIALIKDSKRDL